VKAAAQGWIPGTSVFSPRAEAEPLMRFKTEPGRQMQADFATIRCGNVFAAFCA